MPPIRTFNSAPINQNTSPTAAKQENNATPPAQDEQQQQEQSTPFSAPATTTAASTSNNAINPSAAQPGAPAVPGPTAAPVPLPTKTYPLFDANTNTPAAPQPGARPVPPTAATVVATPTSKTAYTVPPPPKTGEPVQPAAYYAPKSQTTASPTPARYAAQSGFMGGGGTNTVAQEEGIITAAANVPNSTSTPYMSTYQPPNAQPLPSASRFTSIVGNTNGSSNSGPLYAGDDGEESILGESGQKVLDTAKSWMQSAGSKLAEAEAEVWKMVNSK